MTPNVPTPRKLLPYPIYTTNTNLDTCVTVFQKAIQANGEKHDLNIVNLFWFYILEASLIVYK